MEDLKKDTQLQRALDVIKTMRLIEQQRPDASQPQAQAPAPTQTTNPVADAARRRWSCSTAFRVFGAGC